MSDRPADELRAQLRAVRAAVAGLGCKLRRPFMVLFFVSLSVIGSLKVMNQGLIDMDRFK